jgi:hypothetical protein
LFRTRIVDRTSRISGVQRKRLANRAETELLAFLHVLPVPAHAVDGLLDLFRRHPVTGGAVFDLQIVATMQANGLQRIYTFNADDFAGFPGTHDCYPLTSILWPPMPREQITRAERDALLARGEPFIVHPREVAKCTQAYQTDPEILLGCIIVSGTLDTAASLRTEQHLAYGIAITAAERAAYDAFRRVWQTPTDQERAAVMQ